MNDATAQGECLVWVLPLGETTYRLLGHLRKLAPGEWMASDRILPSSNRTEAALEMWYRWFYAPKALRRPLPA